MLSMSGAIFRLSWFISNSYSKSEIARNPLTIALAPCSRAKSTRRVSKGFTCTFPSFSVSARMNAARSWALKRGSFLRTGWSTTPTTTLSNTAEVRPMMSRWPFVTGSYEPGQTAVPPFLSATMDRDAGVAVEALAREREREQQGRPLVGFGHDAGIFGQESRQELRERLRQAGGGIIRGVDQDEVVWTVGGAQEAERVAPDDGAGEVQRIEVAPHERRGTRVALHE